MPRWDYVSCRSCYWVLTRQLVRRLLEVFGPWSHIHELIFLFLIESRLLHWELLGFAEVRQHGLLQSAAGQGLAMSKCAGASGGLTTT